VQYFGQLVQIPAVHHVPGCERVAQVVESEVPDVAHPQDGLETLIHSLSLPLRACLTRKDALPRSPPDTFLTHWPTQRISAHTAPSLASASIQRLSIPPCTADRSTSTRRSRRSASPSSPRSGRSSADDRMSR